MGGCPSLGGKQASTGAIALRTQKSRPQAASLGRAVDQRSSVCLSSPDSYISIMMSEPPMNSPLTYS